MSFDKYIEEKIKMYKECQKKNICQLSKNNTYLCSNIRDCTYIHHYENKIKVLKLAEQIYSKEGDCYYVWRKRNWEM